jgi:hypothetical protein
MGTIVFSYAISALYVARRGNRQMDPTEASMGLFGKAWVTLQYISVLAGPCIFAHRLISLPIHIHSHSWSCNPDATWTSH